MNKYAAAGMLCLALTGLVQGAAAQNAGANPVASATPWYITVGLGKTYADIPQGTVNSINSALTAANGAAASVVDTDNSSTGLKAALGYTFNRYFALEGGYAALGKPSANMQFLSAGPVSTTVGTFDMDYKLSAWFVDAVGMFPVTGKWTLIGRVGASYDRTSASLDGSPVTVIVSSDDSVKTKVRAKFGAGVDYNLNPAFAIRAEWERYRFEDPLSDDHFNLDAAWLSLLLRF